MRIECRACWVCTIAVDVKGGWLCFLCVDCLPVFISRRECRLAFCAVGCDVQASGLDGSDTNVRITRE